MRQAEFWYGNSAHRDLEWICRNTTAISVGRRNHEVWLVLRRITVPTTPSLWRARPGATQARTPSKENNVGSGGKGTTVRVAAVRTPPRVKMPT